MTSSAAYLENLAASYRVLRIPELARSICALLEKKDYVKLLYLCRDTYIAIRPINWETIDLSSLRSFRKTAENINEASKISDNSSLPPNISRENIHLAFVKTLRVSDDDTDVLTDRPGLELPNLQRLIITPQPYVHQWDCQSWLFSLLELSPNLIELRMITADSGDEDELGDQYEECPDLDPGMLPKLLDCLSRKYPRLEKLRLFPSDRESNLHESAYNILACFTHLQSLSLVITNIQEGLLRALGQLPRLESLLLRTSGVSTNDLPPVTVPSGSFPCLKRLALYGLGDRAIDCICKVPELFRQLVTADIIFNDQPTTEDYEACTRSILAVQSMGTNSPYLSDLAIWPSGTYCPLITCMPVIDAFKNMPLTRLRLQGIDFNSSDNEYDSDNPEYEGDEITQSNDPKTQWTALLSALPHLQELHLNGDNLDIFRLQLIASLLPRLRVFVIGEMELDEIDKPFDEVNAAQSIVIRCRSCFKDRAPSSLIIQRAASYMYYLWPNAICEARAVKGELLPDEEPFVQFNKALQTLRLSIEK